MNSLSCDASPFLSGQQRYVLRNGKRIRHPRLSSKPTLIHNWAIANRLRVIIFAILLAALFRSAGASDVQHSPRSEITLCSEDEKVYFSCPLENGKVASVCAKNNTSPDL